VKLRPVSSGWLRSAFFAVLAIIVFITGRGTMARSPYAVHTFTYTFLGIAAIPMIDQIWRRSRIRDPALPPWLPAPPGATYERSFSLKSLTWPVALLLWILVPAVAVAGGINLLVGELVHDVGGSAGAVLAAIGGALGGLAAWMGLTTVVTWRMASGLGRWPAYTEALPSSLRFRSFVTEWRRDPIYYFRTQHHRLGS
jgi:hypothetical protein